MDYKSPFEPEQRSQFDNFELQVNAQAQGFLRETAKWATFISIAVYIFSGLSLLFGLFFLAIGNDIDRAQRQVGGDASMVFSGASMGISYIVFAVMMFIPAVYLGKFAGRMKNALDATRTDMLTDAFEFLKSHYKAAGIVTIISIALTILSIIFLIIAGAAVAAGAV
jgi:hypothetical protein